MVRRRARWLPLTAGLLLTGCMTPLSQSTDLSSLEYNTMKSGERSPFVWSRPAAASSVDSVSSVNYRSSLDASMASQLLRSSAPSQESTAANASLEGRPHTLADLGVTGPLPALGVDPVPQVGPDGKALTLTDVQREAGMHQAVLKQAQARIKTAENGTVRVGLAPHLSAENRNVFLEQLIKAPDKQQAPRAAALLELSDAEIAQRRVENDLATQVRGAYFAVLLAKEDLHVAGTLARLAREACERQSIQDAPAQAAEKRALALQTHAQLVQARQHYLVAWKQLADLMGRPELPPTQLAGRLDGAAPVFRLEALMPRVLADHTDVRSAENGLLQARFVLAVTRTSALTDNEARFLVPDWERTRNAVQTAQANLTRATEGADQARAALRQRLLDAFERHENNRLLLRYYREQILPDQVRYYQGVCARATPAGDSAETATARCMLAVSAGQYATALGQYWQSVVELTDLLQTPDLFQSAQERLELAALPDFDDPASSRPPTPAPLEVRQVRTLGERTASVGSQWAAEARPSAEGGTPRPLIHEPGRGDAFAVAASFQLAQRNRQAGSLPPQADATPPLGLGRRIAEGESGDDLPNGACVSKPLETARTEEAVLTPVRAVLPVNLIPVPAVTLEAPHLEPVQPTLNGVPASALMSLPPLPHTSTVRNEPSGKAPPAPSIIAVGTPDGVDPLLLEPPPDVPRRAVGWK